MHIMEFKQSYLEPHSSNHSWQTVKGNLFSNLKSLEQLALHLETETILLQLTTFLVSNFTDSLSMDSIDCFMKYSTIQHDTTQHSLLATLLHRC